MPQCPDVCNPSCSDYDPNACGGGGTGGTIPNGRIPSGSITVTDDVFNSQQNVRKARVVAKRFLKVERTFTDNNGQYQFTKSFRNKVKLIVKFKNSEALIKGLRGARIWQINFPVKINMGTYRGNLNNITYNIPDNNDERSRGARHWAAAITHNAVQEYHEFANQLNIGVPPQNVKFLIVPSPGATGAAPMFASRLDNSMGINFITKLVIANGNPILSNSNLLLTALRSKLDVLVGYTLFEETRDAAHLCETVFHELTHAAHYNKVGNSWYAYFVGSELSEIILDPLLPGEKPYGDGTRAGSGVIGLGEGWAYYMGHVMTDRKYLAQSPEFREQGNDYNFGAPVPLLSSNRNLLEDFSPLRTNDQFRWIPQGLFYDLFDDRNDFATTANPLHPGDLVNGITNQQLFDAIDSDITDIPAYRQRLLNETGNNQAANVTALFGFYNY